MAVVCAMSTRIAAVIASYQNILVKLMAPRERLLKQCDIIVKQKNLKRRRHTKYVYKELHFDL